MYLIKLIFMEKIVSGMFFILRSYKPIILENNVHKEKRLWVMLVRPVAETKKKSFEEAVAKCNGVPVETFTAELKKRVYLLTTDDGKRQSTRESSEIRSWHLMNDDMSAEKYFHRSFFNKKIVLLNRF